MTSHGSFPPHTRGWTCPDRVPARRPGVSPAHAGMDPAIKSSKSVGVGFPRTRGDGPVEHPVGTLRVAFPPHTRGWTRRAPGRDAPGCVSPAHAGMDPGTAPRRSRTTRFPRTRGDGPSTEDRPLFPTEFPPHTRGWTLGQRRRSGTHRVSPAHAGMDRSSPPWPCGRSCFPRTRGDGPQTINRNVEAGAFPPHTRGWTPERLRDAPG